MTNKTRFTTAITLSLAALLQNANAHLEPKQGDGTEKCYGVVKAHKNDCASKDAKHSCAGFAKTDGSESDWIKLPQGLCSKLASGAVKTESKK